MLGAATFAALSGNRASATGAGPRADTLQVLLRERIDVDKRSVGMAAGIVTARQDCTAAWGRERVSDPELVTTATLFEIGSITKVFTALLLADMVLAGHMKLDDPVASHLPGDFRVPAKDHRPITLADLATHTAGLPRFPTYAGAPRSPEWIAAMAEYSEDEFKAWLADFQPQRPDGTAWAYSNTGYGLLSLALAHRGGRSFESLLQTRVLEPLGLRDTTFHPQNRPELRVAGGHEPDFTPVASFDGGILLAAGALRSSLRDMVGFARAMFLPSSPIFAANQLLLSVKRPMWPGAGQAVGWEMFDSPGGAFVAKDGVTFGQTASLVFDPVQGEAVVVLSNTRPDLGPSTMSGGGVGAADMARHVLRPQIPRRGEGGARY